MNIRSLLGLVPKFVTSVSVAAWAGCWMINNATAARSTDAAKPTSALTMDLMAFSSRVRETFRSVVRTVSAAQRGKAGAQAGPRITMQYSAVRRCGAVADDERRGQFDPVVIERATARELQDKVGGHRAHLHQRLAHRRHRRPRPLRERQVVEADHAQVVRDPHAFLPGGLVHAEGLEVVGAEDR